VFDIDGTLIRWQLYHSMVDHLAKRGLLGKDSSDLIKQERMRWKRREHERSFDEYESFLVDQYRAHIKGLNYQEYLKAARVVTREYIEQCYTYTRDLVKSLKARDYTLLIISGSPEEMIRPLAKHYGFDHFVAAKFAVDSKKRFTGEIHTPVHDKKSAIEKLVDENGLSYKDSYAIGDTENDLPILKMVEHPIAFNPTKKLFQIAKSKGWKIVVERKNVVYQLSPKNNYYQLDEVDDGI